MSKEDPSVKLYRARRHLARLQAWRWPHRVALVGCIIPSFCLVIFILLGVVLFDRTPSGFQAFGLSLLYFGIPGYILYRRRQKTLKETALAGRGSRNSISVFAPPIRGPTRHKAYPLLPAMAQRALSLPRQPMRLAIRLDLSNPSLAFAFADQRLGCFSRRLTP